MALSPVGEAVPGDEDRLHLAAALVRPVLAEDDGLRGRRDDQVAHQVGGQPRHYEVAVLAAQAEGGSPEPGQPLSIHLGRADRGAMVGLDPQASCMPEKDEEDGCLESLLGAPEECQQGRRRRSGN